MVLGSARRGVCAIKRFNGGMMVEEEKVISESDDQQPKSHLNSSCESEREHCGLR